MLANTVYMKADWDQPFEHEVHARWDIYQA